jgi:COP9 signalosome complex subunit 5
MCPDGRTVADSKAAMARWGHAYSRYYELSIEYFMSSLGRNLLSVMSRNSLWIRTLGTTAVIEQDSRQQFVERAKTTSKQIEDSARSVSNVRMSGLQKESESKTDLQTASQLASDVALEQIKGQIAQLSKNVVFNNVHSAHSTGIATCGCGSKQSSAASASDQTSS